MYPLYNLHLYVDSFKFLYETDRKLVRQYVYSDEEGRTNQESEKKSLKARLFRNSNAIKRYENSRLLELNLH